MKMSDTTNGSLSQLPIEWVYHILDNLELFDIILSVRDVCTRLNTNIDTYDPYQVKSISIFNIDRQIGNRFL